MEDSVECDARDVLDDVEGSENIWDEDWSSLYERSAMFGESWRKTQSEDDWPWDAIYCLESYMC